MERLYGSIDLTVLGKFIRNHPELVKKVSFKDGEHQLVSVDVIPKREEDQFGNVAFVKLSCKKDQQKEGVNYYLSNLKVSKYQDEQKPQAQHYATPHPTTTPTGMVDGADSLPF